jgi:isoquinoline 1-oxidoreductase beta subunit
MENTRILNLSRRRFLAAGGAAGAGLILGLRIPLVTADEAAGGPGATAGNADNPEAGPFEPNAFVRIGTDETVTVIVKHLEMGQGTYTGLPTLVAEELDAAWSQVRAEGAPADAERYANLFWSGLQGTGGSTALANSYLQLRRAGAAARQMLVGAAAERWKVPAGEIAVRDGVLSHSATGAEATFGALAADAARQPVPEEPRLKDPADFRLIGTRLPRKDSLPKIEGNARFTQDVTLPRMLTALVLHPPRFGARARTFDPTPALAAPGVTDVIRMETGIAVLAVDFWSAKRGRDALTVEWDESEALTLGSAEILTQYREIAATPGLPARREGDAEAALAGAAQVIEAEITVPYLVHAAMEPMNCVVDLKQDGCDVYNGHQFQTIDREALARVLRLPPEQVRLHMLYAGGSFGRRANPASDYLLEAACIARAIRGRAPVKLQWTREDDTRAGWFRPLYLHRLRAGIDAEGRPVAWEHRIVGQSIIAGTAFEGALIHDGVDQTSVEGAANLPYAIPNLSVELHSPALPVPVQWWRSVGSSHTAFAVETLIDELAAAAGRDPVEYRLSLLGDEHPRHRAVLELAAAKAGWDLPLPEGSGRGVAVHESFDTLVAQVAEVTVTGDQFRVDRVVIAVHCGLAVNPDVVAAQMEGGMGFGLAAALKSAITLDQGRVVESNFHDYRVLRIHEMPRVEVHIVPSADPPTGVGEPATPVIAPAVANALYAATGRRLRSLPLRLDA